MSRDEVRFLYLRDNKGRVATIAREIDRETNSVYFAYSMNCDEDTFRKDFGRSVARERLSSPKLSYPGDIKKFASRLSRPPQGQKAARYSCFGVSLGDGSRPIEAVLTFLSQATEEEHTVPCTLRQMAKKALKKRLAENTADKT